MKKTIILSLIISMLSVSLFGCSYTSEQHPVSAGTSTPENKDTSNEEKDSATNDSQKQNSEVITVEEKVLFEEEGVRATLKGVNGNDFKILLENDSDKNVGLSSDIIIVNGITMYGSLYLKAAAGKKVNGVLSLSSSELQIANISTVANVKTVDAHIFNSDDYSTIKNTNFEFSTSVSEDFIQNIDDTGDILYDQNGITVIAKNLNKDIWGNALYVLIKNNTESDIVASADNLSVNGFTLNSFQSDTIAAGTVRFCDIEISSTGLSENEIENIENVSFTMSFRNSDSYDTIATTEELNVIVK